MSRQLLENHITDYAGKDGLAQFAAVSDYRDLESDRCGCLSVNSGTSPGGAAGVQQHAEVQRRHAGNARLRQRQGLAEQGKDGMTDFDIRPYEGVGPLAFGMTPEEVHALVGEPRMQRPNPLGQRDERYDGFRVRYAADTNLMCEVTFSTTCSVTLEGISLLADATAVQQLAERYGQALQGLGYIVFPNLGIALADFGSDQETDNAVTVYARGEWTDLKGFNPL